MPSAIRPDDLLEFGAAFAVGTLAIARLTRLLVEDTYPPVAWFRRLWDRWTQRSDWNDLFHCSFCAAPYIAAVDVALAFITRLHWIWWAVNIWLAVSYIAAMIVVRDIPSDQR